MAEQKEEKRTLGFWVALSIVIGGVIGSGIFKNPASMAAELQSGFWLIMVWVIAGVVSMFGALTNAEIAGMIPATGGQFMFYKKVFGNFTGFMYGWAAFFVIQSGSAASITYVFSEYTSTLINLPRFDAVTEKSILLHIPYVGDFFPLENFGVKALTIAVIWLLTLINVRGASMGGRVQVLFTGLKLFAMVFIVGMVFGWGGSAHAVSSAITDPIPIEGITLAAFMAAIGGAFWGYDGWNNLTFVAGEVKNPQRNIARALFWGLIVVIAVYVIINLAYLYVLDINSMSKSVLVATDAVATVTGKAVIIVALAIMISTFGASNGTIMSSARIYFAMAREGLFFKSVGKLHPKFETPAISLIWAAVWSSVLVLSGTFDMLTGMLIFVAWIFYALSAVSVIILRVREPKAERPYKVWGYPIIPLIFIAFSLVFLVVTLNNDINDYQAGKTQVVNSVFGLVIVATGIPFYFLFKKSGGESDKIKA